jgi:FdhE protein
VSEAGLVGGGALGEVPYLRPHPGAAAIFQRRAARLLGLAPGHATEDYLRFLAGLAADQAAVAAGLPRATPAAFEPGCLPLPTGTLPPTWRDALRALVRAVRSQSLPEPVREALEQLLTRPDTDLDGLGARALAGRPAGDELAEATLVGAALQVVYTAAAATVPGAQVGRTEEGCPVCGSPPAVGIVLGDDKLRYLVCGVCATEWHHTRVQCVSCRSAGALSYLVVEGRDGAVKAETCDGCRAYLKLLYVEQSPGLEPLADDVATLPLDLLVAERGLLRLGANPLLATAAGADA